MHNLTRSGVLPRAKVDSSSQLCLVAGPWVGATMHTKSSQMGRSSSCQASGVSAPCETFLNKNHVPRGNKPNKIRKIALPVSPQLSGRVCFSEGHAFSMS
jgi:hypothetical protein